MGDIIDGHAGFTPDPEQSGQKTQPPATPPTWEELQEAAAASDQKRDAMGAGEGYGLTRFAEMYEEKIQKLEKENGQLKIKVADLEYQALYIQSLVNCIRSTAFGKPTPADEPDLSRELSKSFMPPNDCETPVQSFSMEDWWLRMRQAKPPSDIENSAARDFMDVHSL